MIPGSSHPVTAASDDPTDVRAEEAVRAGLRVRRFRSLSLLDPVVADTDGLAASPDASVAVVGLAGGGLVTALALHDAGLRVCGVDLSRRRLDEIASGRGTTAIGDPSRLRDALVSTRFSLSSELRAVSAADMVVVCVPSALDAHMAPDLAPLANACADVVRLARAGQLIVLTSTSYVGTTTDLLVRPLQAFGFDVGSDVNVAFSAERHARGDGDCGPAAPRIVAGATPACRDRALRALAPLGGDLHPVASTDVAEMTHLTERAFAAVGAALIGELASACDELGVPIADVLGAAATDPAGPVRAVVDAPAAEACPSLDSAHLTWQMRRYRHRLPVVEAALGSIMERPHTIVERAQGLLAERGIAPGVARVLIVGIADTADGADAHDAAALEVAHRLRRMGAIVDLADSRVASARLADGTVLPVTRLQDVDVSAPDLVVLQTPHDDDDLAPLADARLVYDASCRIAAERRRRASTAS